MLLETLRRPRHRRTAKSYVQLEIPQVLVALCGLFLSIHWLRFAATVMPIRIYLDAFR